MPWVVVGDFNVVFDQSEKLGGLPFNSRDVSAYARIIQRSGLEDLGFKG